MASTAALPDVQAKRPTTGASSPGLVRLANHAYITTTASTFFPPYFIAIATAASCRRALSTDQAATAWRGTAPPIPLP